MFLFIQCTDRMERDRLILFLNKLILNKENAKAVIDAKGVHVIVDLLTLAHMHTSRYAKSRYDIKRVPHNWLIFYCFVFSYLRAMIPTQSNVIEAGSDMMRDNEKEWYYGSGEERKGPVTFSEVNFPNFVSIQSCNGTTSP